MTAQNSFKIKMVDTAIIESALQGEQPVILWLANDQSMPTEVRKALEDQLQKHADKLVIYAVDTSRETALGEQFSVGKHPVLVAWYHGEVVARRSRPWATDAITITQNVLKLLPVAKSAAKSTPVNGKTKENHMNNKPVIVTDETFQAEVLDSEIPVLIDFWAEWCGPCRMVAPILEKLAGEYAGKVKIAKVDVDANQGLSQAFRIMSIPTLMFVKEGKIVGQSAGAAPEPALRDVLEQLIALEIPATEPE